MVAANNMPLCDCESNETCLAVLSPTTSQECHAKSPCGRRPPRHRPAMRPVSTRTVSLVRKHLENGIPVVRPQDAQRVGFRRVQRTLDIVGALGLLVCLAPVMLAIFLVLMVTTRGKPLFWQRRAGYLGRPFWLAKFRSMRPDASALQAAVRNEVNGPVFKNRRDPRVTRLGRLLRKTSLDETPQLFHVLFGQMSLVGPRPLDLAEIARFQPWQLRRLAVRPGLTCLWQVSGRSEVGFQDWMRMDLWYVRHQSLWTDCKLLLSTPWSVIAGKGAY